MTAPRNGWFVPLAWILFLGSVAAVSCGRTDFETGASANATGTGGAGGSASLINLPATPGLFICGASLCATATQQCCVGASSSGSVTTGCQPLTTTCSGLSLQCDEPADCSGANVCCAGLGAGGGTSFGSLGALGTECVAASRCMGTGQFIVCRQDSDCHGAGVCCAGAGLPTCLATCPKI